MGLVKCICKFCNRVFLHPLYETFVCEECHHRFREHSKRFL